MTASPVRSSVSLPEVPDTIRSGTAEVIEGGRQPEEAGVTLLTATRRPEISESAVLARLLRD